MRFIHEHARPVHQGDRRQAPVMMIGIVGSAGHGKTGLAEALAEKGTSVRVSGKNADRTGGIVYRFFRLKDREIGLADIPCPGGRPSMTMTGMAGIDLALLVVAADEGVTGQTRELIAALDLLGVSRSLVAIARSDLVSALDLAALGREIRCEVDGTALADSPIVAVSARTGEGLQSLVDALCERAGAQPGGGEPLPFRLAIDRVFPLPGGETAVTGRVLAGCVRKGDRLIVSPEGLEAGILSIHRHGLEAPEAETGDRCSLVLVGEGISTKSVRRGHVLVDPELHAPSRRFDIELRHAKGAGRLPDAGMAVRAHCLAEEAVGRLYPFQPENGCGRFARLVLDVPIAACAGDRILIRDLQENRLLGGGPVLDIPHEGRRLRRPERGRELAQITGLDPASALMAYLEETGTWVDCHAWFRNRGRGRQEAKREAERLGLTVLKTSDLFAVLSPAVWDRVSQEIADRLDRVHAERQDLPGLGIEKLRCSLSLRLPAALFEAAIARLEREGCARRHKNWLRRPWFRAMLPAEDRALWDEIAPHLAGADRFSPPRVRDLARRLGAPEEALRRVLRLAAGRGDVTEIARDRFLASETVSHLTDILRDLADTAPEGFSLRAFCDRIGAGRKVAIAILEFFDRKGVTRRDGNQRRLARSAPAASDGMSLPSVEPGCFAAGLKAKSRRNR